MNETKLPNNISLNLKMEFNINISPPILIIHDRDMGISIIKSNITNQFESLIDQMSEDAYNHIASHFPKKEPQ